nr:BrnA antitoxin family protein [Brasilonema bromeliae]
MFHFRVDTIRKPGVPKVPVNMRLDADVVAWFKNRQSRGYQTLINFVLRE